MAFYNDQDDEELQQQNGEGPQQSGPQAGGVIDAGAAQSGGNAPKQATPDRGSNFVGITNYLNANKNQAGKLGDQASGVISGAADQARSGLTNLNNNFNQKAGSAATIDQNVLGKVNQAETLQDQEKQQIKQAYNAQYGGPNSLADLGDEYNATGTALNKAKQNVESAGTEEGRKGLITQINEKPRTSGITNFDSLLLQTGQGRNKVEQTAQANKDLTQDLLGQSNLAAQQKAADIKTQTDLTRQQTQGAVSGAQQALQKQFDGSDPNSKLAQARNNWTQTNTEVARDLGDQSALSDSIMKALGLSEGQKIYNLDLNNYRAPLDAEGLTAESVASQEEKARAQALADLSGGQSIFGQSTGTQYDSNALGIDASKFKQDLASKDQAYQQALNTSNPNFLKLQDFLNKGYSNITDPYEYMFGGQKEKYRAMTPKQMIDIAKNGDPYWSGGLGADALQSAIDNFYNQNYANRTAKLEK